MPLIDYTRLYIVEYSIILPLREAKNFKMNIPVNLCRNNTFYT